MNHMTSRRLNQAPRVLVLVALVTGCAGGDEGSKGVVYGLVRLESCGPGPCIRAKERSHPLRGARLVFTRHEDVAATTTTDAQGRYRVSLERGKYDVTAENDAAFTDLRPRRLVVTGAKSRRADFAVTSSVL
jgi:hypothetical protein